MGAQCSTGCKNCCSDENQQLKDQFPAFEPSSVLEDATSAEDDPGSQKTPAANIDENSPLYFFCMDHADFELIDARQGPGLRPPHTFRSGAVYHGEWQGRYRHGFGVQRWPGGVVYEGQWVKNAANNMGIFSRPGEESYCGNWKDNTAHGVGCYSRHSEASKNPSVFRGEWNMGIQSGHGVEALEGDGTRYEGAYKDGQKHGHGTYVWSDRGNHATFSGLWASNRIDGAGEYKQANGSTFRGMWKDSVIHGSGKYAWSDGRIYAGQYMFDRKEGFGSFQWSDGRRYDGFWSAGKQHGGGRYINENGEMKNVTFDKGVMISLDGEAPQ